MSTPIYLKSGVAARDAITLQTPAGTFTTGKVDGDFTKKLVKDATGNQSTTGITITEVDASNNAGQYTIALAASGIPATNGTYHLLVYLTANPEYSFEQVFVVTQDGLPGSVGTLSFTSSTNDGRVTDTGGSPISGVNVFLSKTGYLVSTTTDANGNWGPIYFDASFGTVTISVSKTGYQTATDTLTVGASSVTGPGTDIALTAITSSSNILASELWAYAGRMAHNKSGTQADTRKKAAVNDAIFHLASERDWNWYKRRGMLSLNAPYSTGTLTLTNGSATVTLTGGTFPSWAGVGKLYISNRIYDIDSRDSDTQVTLIGTFGGTSDDYSYTLFNDTYALPVNFLEFGQIMQGQAWPWQPEPVSIETLWYQQNAFTTGQTYSSVFAIHYGKLNLWPYPSEAYNVNYTYKARPALLTSDSDIADVDPTWLSVLQHLINYYVAIHFGDCVAGSAEQCLKQYQEAYSHLPSNDKSPRGIGNRRNNPKLRDPFSWWNNQT